MLIRDLLKNTAARHVGMMKIVLIKLDAKFTDFEELSSVGTLVDTVARDINLAISKNERVKKYDVLEKSNHNLKRVIGEVFFFPFLPFFYYYLYLLYRFLGSYVQLQREFCEALVFE
jgi:hypothetical protein